MTVDFSLEITREDIEEAVLSFHDEHEIDQLTPYYALEYILTEKCQFDSLCDADILIENMDASHKKVLLDSFVDAYMCLLKKRIEQQLGR